METISAEQLGRAGVGIAEDIGYNRGYKDGRDATLRYANKFLDEETINEIKTMLKVEGE